MADEESLQREDKASHDQEEGDREGGKEREKDRDKERKHRERRKDRDGEDEEERRRRKKRHREKKRLREEAGLGHHSAGRDGEEGELMQPEETEHQNRAEKDSVLEPGEIETGAGVPQKSGLAFKVSNGISRVSSSSRVNIFDGLKEEKAEKSPSHGQGQDKRLLVHDLDAPGTSMQMLASAYTERGEAADDSARKSRQDLDRVEEKRRRDAEREVRHGSKERRSERGSSADARRSARTEGKERYPSSSRASQRTEDDSVDRRVRSKSRESLRSRGRSQERRPHVRDGAADSNRHRSRSRDTVLEPPPPPPRRRDTSVDRRRESSPVRRGSREPSYRRGDKDRQADYRGSRDEYRSRRSESRGRREDSRAPSSRVDPEEELRKKVEEEQKRKKEEEEFKARVARQLQEQQEAEVDPEKVLEESRKRREAILAKYRQQKAAQGASQAPAGDKSRFAPTQAADPGAAGTANGAVVADGTMPRHASSQPVAALLAPAADTNMTDAETSAPAKENGQSLASGQLDAASYRETASDVGKGPEGGDMFSDDMFGDTPVTGRKLVTANGAMVDAGLVDNWDDPDGYYTFRIGEVLDKRYEVLSSHGRGVFSTVVRARDRLAKAGEPQEVAIKIIRNNDTMFKAGQQELVILRKLSGADPENRRHCVRLLTSFEYRDHLCLVFESLNMNLREVLKKFGRNIGLNLTAVRAYAQQLFISLKHLKNCGVLHADIKPDNMLVNEQKNMLKLCDFGSAMFNGDNEITPYLVSRFYRAPEIILGLTYDHAMDMWSIGCCLYELYTGKILFPGGSNNEMLKLMMELKGPFPKKMLKKAAFAERHFDQDYTFGVIEEDPVTHQSIKRIMTNLKGKDLGALLQGSARGSEDKALLANFKDLLERVLTLDPEKRLDVSAALKHPFISGK